MMKSPGYNTKANCLEISMKALLETRVNDGTFGFSGVMYEVACIMQNAIKSCSMTGNIACQRLLRTICSNWLEKMEGHEFRQILTYVVAPLSKTMTNNINGYEFRLDVFRDMPETFFGMVSFKDAERVEALIRVLHESLIRKEYNKNGTRILGYTKGKKKFVETIVSILNDSRRVKEKYLSRYFGSYDLTRLETLESILERLKIVDGGRLKSLRATLRHIANRCTTVSPKVKDVFTKQNLPLA